MKGQVIIMAAINMTHKVKVRNNDQLKKVLDVIIPSKGVKDSDSFKQRISTAKDTIKKIHK